MPEDIQEGTAIAVAKPLIEIALSGADEHREKAVLGVGLLLRELSRSWDIEEDVETDAPSWLASSSWKMVDMEKITNHIQERMSQQGQPEGGKLGNTSIAKGKKRAASEAEMPEGPRYLVCFLMAFQI